MIKVYGGIEGIEVPEFNSKEEYSEYSRKCDEYEQKLVDFAKRNSNSRIAGEIVKFGVADGSARYVVVKPTEIIHINTHDGYDMPYIDRLNGKDITAAVKRAKAWKDLFNKNKK